MSDVYLPHTYKEVRGLVARGVAARLDPDENYGALVEPPREEDELCARSTLA